MNQLRNMFMGRPNSHEFVVAALIQFWLLGSAIGKSATPRMLKVYPVGNQTCVATSLALSQGQALSGLTWYHNDSEVAFPMVVLLEGTPGQAPSLNEAAMVLAEVSGASLAWGSLSLEIPVISSTGIVDVVFLYPENTEISGLGEGGGPGVGILTEASGTAPYLSYDGASWTQFDAGHRLAVDPVYAQGKVQATVLASLKGTIPGGQFSKRTDGPERRRTTLHAAQPNPFNPRTQIRFELAEAGPAKLKIYDLRGRLVTTLLEQKLEAGPHELVWQGTDRRGRSVASGGYFLVLTAGGERFRQKLILLR